MVVSTTATAAVSKMRKSSFIFGLTCLLAFVNVFVEGQFNMGDVLIQTGTAIKACTAKYTYSDTYCMTGCMAKQYGLMGPDNKFNFTRIDELAAPLKNIDPGSYKQELAILQKCSEEVTSYADECIVMKELAKCTAVAEVKMLF